ncbi:hypothetical protein WA1_34440 [Scytonema hofmannii PCC 7110]|uniref:Uncharacterized protein n=1 Tax=Scytonema hofmannii PCC 7110 TaxID=128403 RepID=A0A139X346_9CYAN|nr:hypothetical protein WA1_34440 [Scytonema hofmannii PCC 7110]
MSYGSNKSYFASAIVQLDRPDVSKALNSSLYEKSGWEANISFRSIPIGETVIKAWIYEPDIKQFVRLNNKPKIQIVE